MINSYAETDNIPFFAVDLGYAVNCQGFFNNTNKQITNGINVGTLASFAGPLLGMQVFADLSNNKPKLGEGPRDFVDVAGCARLGYNVNWFGFGIDLGGYRLLHECIGEYYNGYRYPDGVYVKSNYAYTYESKFNAGAFVLFRFCRYNLFGFYIMAESTHVNPIMATFGITLNY